MATVEEIVTDIDAMQDLSTPEKVNMFVSICDHERLMECFKKQSLMQRMGMANEDDVYSFAYGVMKLARPDLFMERG